MAQLNTTRETPVSVMTVSRRLHEVGLKGCIAAKKRLLRKNNVRAEMPLVGPGTCKLDCSKVGPRACVRACVLWSDESKFELFESRWRMFVRRMKHERYAKTCIRPTVKHGGGNVMVWGCFAGDQLGDLVR
eukprot:Pompholyxophrys_punicea_v1_NODE_836_length_1229_cov_1.688245.p2 type:complete len:131 gc:universal NODE_836_length_1229_cov_1.688245:442-834(+)